MVLKEREGGRGGVDHSSLLIKASFPSSNSTVPPCSTRVQAAKGDESNFYRNKEQLREGQGRKRDKASGLAREREPATGGNI